MTERQEGRLMGWQLAVGESELELPLLNHMESCQTGFVNKTHTFFSFLFGGVSLLFIFFSLLYETSF